MRYALVTVLGLSLLVVSNAEGQKHCRKGIPCGNTCIAANKVCRIGTPSTPATTPPLPTAAPARTAPNTVAQTNNAAWVAFIARAHVLPTGM